MAMFGIDGGMMVAVLVFLAATTLMFCVMVAVRSHGSVRRRAAVIGGGFIGPVHVEALRRIGVEVVGLLSANA